MATETKTTKTPALITDPQGAIRHYFASLGIMGYAAGDVLVGDDGNTSIAVATGAGIQLEPCVLDIPFERAELVSEIRYRLAPLDVGFDLRGEEVTIALGLEECIRASYATWSGERRVVSGPRSAVIAILENEGYKVWSAP